MKVPNEQACLICGKRAHPHPYWGFQAERFVRIEYSCDCGFHWSVAEDPNGTFYSWLNAHTVCPTGCLLTIREEPV